MFQILTIALILSLSTVSTQAQIRKVAASGVPIILFTSSAINPDCSSLGRPVVKTLQAPEHGRIMITNAPVFTNFPASNVRSACNRQRVSGVIAKYVSQRGYTGIDSAAVEVIHPTGRAQRGAFIITVR